jgi:hypothetical protein
VRRIADPTSGQPSTSTRLALLRVALLAPSRVRAAGQRRFVHVAELHGRSSPCGFIEEDRMKGENKTVKTQYGHDRENQIIAPRRPE